MDWQSEILRFQKGVRSQHSAPEASFETAPVGTHEDAGQALAILVDLSPYLPHRSREIRVIVAESYWHSEGSVVARLRRALAKANRYLANANAGSQPDQRASGCITCVALAEEELFLGQVGPANALLYHPESGMEAFPRDNRPLLPLGARRPPIIHISYADVLPGATLLLASTPVAECANPGAWTKSLAQTGWGATVAGIESLLGERGATGSAVVVHRTSTVATAAPAKRSPWKRIGRPKRATQESAAPKRKTDPESKREPVVQPEAEGEAGEEIKTRQEIKGPQKVPAAPKRERTPQEVAAQESEARPQERRPRLRLPRFQLPRLRIRKWWTERSRPKLRLPKISFKPVVSALLPGKVSSSSPRRRRRVPEENTTVMSGLTVGFLLLVILITLTAYFDMGGDTGAQEKLTAANAALEAARRTQTLEDWRRVRQFAEQARGLDSDNAEAQELLETASAALDALESAAILEGTPLMHLGGSPRPRRVLVKQQWAYILNPATDQVIGLPLKEDGITPASNAFTPILQKGDTVNAEEVGPLVDLAWLEPRSGYPDGALLVYSDDGNLYIYEPALGPSSIDRQPLDGPMQPGDVTLIETYAGQFYLLDRQANQIWKYVAVHGTYDGPPRPYFPPEQAPALQTALSVALDGRLYLLMGDGNIHTYFNGTEDLSFRLQNLPSPQYHPRVMTIEPALDVGYLYLSDPDRETIIVVNKQGTYQHQFRLPRLDLQTLETLTVSMEPHILYFVVQNQLYATPIPTFTSQ